MVPKQYLLHPYVEDIVCEPSMCVSFDEFGGPLNSRLESNKEEEEEEKILFANHPCVYRLMSLEGLLARQGRALAHELPRAS